MLEVAGQQAREALGGQVHLLEQDGLAVGQAQPLDVQGGRSRFQLEGRGDGRTGRLGPRADEPRLGVEAAAQHLLAEALRVRQVTVDARRDDGGAASSGTQQASLAGQLAQRAADGDEAAAVAAGQLALRWQQLVGAPLAGVQRAAQVEIDLVVQRDGAELQAGAGQSSLR